jgi:DNA-directed RNA polymerase subunit RPC12/RpoP
MRVLKEVKPEEKICKCHRCKSIIAEYKHLLRLGDHVNCPTCSNVILVDDFHDMNSGEGKALIAEVTNGKGIPTGLR